MNTLFEKFKDYALTTEQASQVKGGGITLYCNFANDEPGTPPRAFALAGGDTLAYAYEYIDYYNEGIGSDNPVVGCESTVTYTGAGIGKD